MMNPASVSIRPASEGDARAIAKVHVQSWRETYQGLVPAEVLANLSEAERTDIWATIIGAQNSGESFVFGAWMDGELVGFADGGKPRGDIESADSELYAIYVLQCAQGQQVGRRLFQALTSRLFKGGCRRMFLWVLQGNPSAGFYERLGGRSGPLRDITIGGRQFAERSYVFELNECQDENITG
jgi:ribosomal protein S18 acetylase RimI-like enzyme